MRAPLEIITALRLPAPRGILQVGANSGQEIDYFQANGISHAALIEPLQAPFEVLAARCSRAGYLPIQALCGEIDGQEVDFYVASNNGESSSILRPARHLQDFPWVEFPQTVRMNTFTLDRILAAINNHHPDIAQALDMLYMDVQGAELRVLKGANAVLHQMRYLYTEVGIGGGYEDDVELLTLAQFLRFYNFRLYELETDPTGWGNALFIKSGNSAAAGLGSAKRGAGSPE